MKNKSLENIKYYLLFLGGGIAIMGVIAIRGKTTGNQLYYLMGILLVLFLILLARWLYLVRKSKSAERFIGEVTTYETVRNRTGTYAVLTIETDGKMINTLPAYSEREAQEYLFKKVSYFCVGGKAYICQMISDSDETV